jgi:hypothetical protein
MALRNPRINSAVMDHARNPDPSGSRSAGDPSDAGIDAFREITQGQLIPAIANRTRNAISVDGRSVLLFQRLRSGRRCSCWIGANTSPNSDCPVCLDTGFSGGYFKWGTDQYLMDPSREWRGVNVLLNPLIGVPPWFTLETGAVSGYIEWFEDMLNTNYYGLDVSRFEYRRSGGNITFKLKLEGSDLDYIPFTEEALKQRILLANGRRIFFRVYLKRAVASDPSPMFLYFMFRTLVLSPEPPILIVDIPRRNESVALQEFGIIETLNQINMVFSDVVKRINVEDAIIRLFDMTRWKVIESSPNDPKNILTSHDVNIRKAYEDEAINKIIM